MRISDDSRLADRRVAEYFLREQARRESKPIATAAPACRASVVTISRQYGAGGHTLAEMLARELGGPWQVWDREIIDAVAQSAHVRREMIEALDERAQPWIERTLRNITNVPVIDPSAYRHHIAEVVLALAHQGHKIIVGRGANLILPDALKIRMCAAVDFRVETVMRIEGISRDAALRRVQRVDRDRAEFLVTVFGRGVDDPRAYDLVIQVDILGLHEAAAAIAAAARVRSGAAR